MTRPSLSTLGSRFALAAMTVGLGLVLTAPAGAAPTTVTIAQGVDPNVLDPAHDTLISSVSTMSNIFDTLILRTGTGDLVPALAESWSFPTNTVMELKLRRGVTFHDGSPFTAEDVAFTLNRYVRKENPVQFRPQIAGIVDRAEAVDANTVRLIMPAPQATIMTNLARYPILSKTAFERVGERAYGLAPVGTGPYRLVRWDKNQQIVLEAYDKHWRGRATVDRVVVKPIPEDFVRFAAFKRGEVDIIANVTPERVPEVKADPNLGLATVRSVRNMFVGMNTFKPPFNDIRVRQALNHAIDKKGLIEAILGGFGVENPSVCSGAIFGFDAAVKPYEYNPVLAKKLLAEAGHPNGFEIVMWGSNGRYLKDKELQEAITGQLAAVGIRVTLRIPEWSEYLKNFLPGKIETMYFIGTGNPILDCDATMGYRIDTRRGGKYYNSPQVDGLIKDEISELDPAKRKEIFKKIQTQIRDDAPWVFLFDNVDTYGVRARIDWKPRADEMIWAYDIKLRN